VNSIPSQYGLPEVHDLKAELARDVFLQIAGMEDVAGLGPIDLSKLAKEIVNDRNVLVLNSLGNAIELTDLRLDSETLTVGEIEERIPYARIVFMFHTSQVMLATWNLFKETLRRREDNA
jgi:hypothetical protein